MASQAVSTDGSSVSTGNPRAIAASASRADPARRPLRDTGLPECPFTVLRRPIRNRHQANPRHRRSELQGDGAAGRAGSNHSDADRMTRGLTLSKGGIYDSCRACLLPLDERPVAILFGNCRGGQGPLNAERRIVESHAAHCAWGVERRGHVVHLRVIPQASGIRAHSARARKACDRSPHSTLRRTICHRMGTPA